MAGESLHNLSLLQDLHLVGSKSIITPVLSGAAWTFRITDPPGTQVVGRAAAGSRILLSLPRCAPDYPHGHVCR